MLNYNFEANPSQQELTGNEFGVRSKVSTNYHYITHKYVSSYVLFKISQTLYLICNIIDFHGI